MIDLDNSVGAISMIGGLLWENEVPISSDRSRWSAV
jgi:hypothetical protein